MQHTIDGEGWQMYHNVPPNASIEGTPHQHKISTNLEDTLVEVIEEGRLKQYWTSHHVYNSEAEEDIDWAAIATACEKKSFKWKRWSSKMASSFIPTGAVMEDQGLWKNSKCPRNCGGKLETSEHVLTCPKANVKWTQLSTILKEWGCNADADPAMIQAINDGISSWRSEEQATARDDNNEAEDKQVGEENHPEDQCMVKEASHHQHMIGWGAAALGFLSNKWQLVQQQHFHKTGSNQSSKQVIAVLIRKLWDISWDLWNHRNRWIEAGKAKMTQDMIASLQERICLHYNKGTSGVSIHTHHLFKIPLNSILIKPVRDQIAWLACVVASRLQNKHCLRTFKVANQTDIKLIDGLTTGGLLRNFLSAHKEPHSAPPIDGMKEKHC